MDTETRQPRDAGNWAKPVATLNAPGTPAGALALNVEGRRLVGAQQGFGQLWQKTYRVRLHGADVTPQSVVDTWKQHFGAFWPAGRYRGEVVFERGGVTERFALARAVDVR